MSVIDESGITGYGEVPSRLQQEAASAASAGSLADGKPCGHPGCLNHVTHPCERCGRIAGRKSE